MSALDRFASACTRAAAEFAAASGTEQYLAQRAAEIDHCMTMQCQLCDINAREMKLRAEQIAVAARLARVAQRERAAALLLTEGIAAAQARCAALADKLAQIHDLRDFDPAAVRALAAELRALAQTPLPPPSPPSPHADTN
jgi:hypothetical protein